MLTLVLVLSALLIVHSTHLIYSESSVTMDQTSILLDLLDATETINLRTPIYLQANRKYGITFKFNSNSGVTRSLRGANAQNNGQSALFLNRTNASWVFPSSLAPWQNAWDFYFDPNVGTSFKSTSDSLTLDTRTMAGFGQTWDSASGGMFSSFNLRLPGGVSSGDAINVAMNIYDLSAFNGVINPMFQFFQETKSPTRFPTKTPTQAPTPQPTQAPTRQPTQAPTPAFFNPPGCDSTFIPSDYQDSQVLCNQSNATVPNVTDTKVISGVITITIVDKNGTKIVVKDLPKDKRIYFFIELTPAGQALLARNDPCEPAPELSCAWLSGNDWLVSGCELAPELGTKNANGKEGRFCACDHLTSFSLVLRPQTNAELCSVTRYVMAGISGVIAVAALVQMARSYLALRACSMLVNIHLAVFSGSLLHMAISLLAPTLSTEPAILVFLSSIVTFIELGCYIYLVYVWLGFTGNTINLIEKLKWPFRIFLLLTLLIAVGIPIAMISSEQSTQLSLARVGSYLMCVITAILCFGLTFSGLKLRRQLVAVKSNLLDKRCSFPTRILLGSIGLGGSVLAQAIFWAASVDDSVISNNDVADGIDLGFNLSAFLTFITLLFMFFFGVNDATTRKSKRTGTHGSRISRGSETGSRSETIVTPAPRTGGAIALGAIGPALPQRMPDLASLPKRRFSYLNTDDDLPDLPLSPAPPSDSPPPPYYEPNEYSSQYDWEHLDKA